MTPDERNERIETYWLNYLSSLQTINVPTQDYDSHERGVYHDHWERYNSDYHVYQQLGTRVYDYHPLRGDQTTQGKESDGFIRYFPGRNRHFNDIPLTDREIAAHYIFGAALDPNTYKSNYLDRLSVGIVQRMYDKSEVLDLEGHSYQSDFAMQGLSALYKTDLYESYIRNDFNVQLPVSDEMFADVRVSDYKPENYLPHWANMKINLERPVKYMDGTIRMLLLNKGTTLYKARFSSGITQIVMRKPELSVLLLNVGE